jgi:hypothetical protein
MMNETEFWAGLGLPYWAALGVAYAAFWIWLTARLVNGRKRWAKGMVLATVFVPVLYVMSSGPMKAMSWHRHVTHNELSPGGPIVAQTMIDPGVWWLRAYAPLWWVSEQGWGEPVSWYWDLFPIRPTTFSP